ncbi:hypothetical protein JS756_14120 [Streptomyces actuosus]|uniref:TPM domain-containing protein n=1 Tax=Streptomyces actuosus TaxID=1885 RepID=A0ABS2VQ34_STRAS|nr:hypothetical protein [Streptomyces actuosus]
MLGGTAALVWLVLPGTTSPSTPPVAVAPPGPSASAAGTAAAQQDETDPADLVLPLLVVGAAGAAAGYAYVRRTRRARRRTTPPARPPDSGGTATGPRTRPAQSAAGEAVPPADAVTPAGPVVPSRPYEPGLGELDRQACAALVEADDCVRAAREELPFAEAAFGAQAVEPYVRAVREAQGELTAALRMRRRYDDGVPAEEAARRQALAGIVGRCAEAGRRLDAKAPGLDRLRAQEEAGAALGVAETRFRELTGRTAAAQATLDRLGEQYAPAASADVTGYVEQAKDRLVFATARLNRARQAADLGDTAAAAAHLRAAEGAVAQADVLVGAVERLAGDLSGAEGMVGAALTGAEAELAAVRVAHPATAPGERPAGAETGTETERPPRAPGTPPAGPGTPGEPGSASPGGPAHDLPPGELRSLVMHADAVLASVRHELTRGRPWDPPALLRRITVALAPVASGRAGVLPAAARLTAGSAVAAAEGFVATHRGAVGAPARTRLAAAGDLLGSAGLAEVVHADVLARQARDLAEQDVRLHGTPSAGTVEDVLGAAGAVLGGILLPGGTPASFGGPRTRGRRTGRPDPPGEEG